MDEAMLKSGQFPNVAIMAGSDPKEVMREYGQTDTEHMDNGVCVHMCPYDTGAHSNVSQNLSDTREDMLCVDHEGNVTLCKIPDTRELLEADVRSEYYGGIESEADEIIGWLDRQAAITRRECEERLDFKVITAVANIMNADLTAERDKLTERVTPHDSISSIDGIANLLVQFEDLTAEREKLLAKVDELTAERDQLSRDLTAEHALVVQFEHDNEKIKADLKTANDTINTLRASVAGLKETVEKLGSK